MGLLVEYTLKDAADHDVQAAAMEKLCAALKELTDRHFLIRDLLQTIRCDSTACCNITAMQANSSSSTALLSKPIRRVRANGWPVRPRQRRSAPAALRSEQGSRGCVIARAAGFRHTCPNDQAT